MTRYLFSPIPLLAFLNLLLSLALAVLPPETAAQETEKSWELSPSEMAGMDFRPLANARGENAEEAQGDWRSVGYGYRFEIGARSVSLFCETESYVYAVDPGGESDGLFFAEVPQSDGILLTSSLSEAPYLLERVPDSETTRVEPDPNDKQDAFGVFAETMGEHYAFFDLWKVDWEERVQVGLSQLSAVTNDTELFSLFESMLAGIEDGHLGLHAELPGGPRGLQHGRSPTLSALRRLHSKQSEIVRWEDYYRAWRGSYRSGVLDVLLGGEGKSLGGNDFLFGWLSEDVGYLNIGQMEGSGSGSFSERISTTQDRLDEILTSFEDAQALVIDLTLNGGGREAFVNAMASRFIEEPLVVHTKLPVTSGDLTFLSIVDPSARARFLKPIVVVASDLTISAGESLILALSQLPQVTLMGQSTAGAFSNVLEKPLPGGFHLSLSNECYVNDQGVCFEGVGIPPDVLLTVFEQDDPWEGHIDAIYAALDTASDW